MRALSGDRQCAREAGRSQRRNRTPGKLHLMRTLCLRNVPDDVFERLERLPALASMSVGAVAVRELSATSRRVDNPALLGALRDFGIDPARAVEVVEEGHSAR